ncbi:MAG: hypothetical protein WBQ94_07085 [Terracidiphilus sp.]
MTSIAISNANLSSAEEASSTSRAAQPQAESAVKPAVLQPDTVKLSPAAQAKMMHRAGQSPALIAATLGTNIAAVDGYLNIKVAAQATVTPEAPTNPQTVASRVEAPAPASSPEPAAPASSPMLAAKE